MSDAIVDGQDVGQIDFNIKQVGLVHAFNLVPSSEGLRTGLGWVHPSLSLIRYLSATVRPGQFCLRGLRDSLFWRSNEIPHLAR